MKHLFAVVGISSTFCMCGSNLLAGPPHGHEGDFAVAHTAAGQLTIDFDFSERIELPPVDALLQGWAHDDPGFVTLDMDEPDEDVFGLDSGANVVLETVSIDPVLKIWNPDLLDAPGEQLILGSPEFHTHVIFHIDSTDAAFDPQTAEYQLSFRLLDNGTTGYATSQTFVASFVPVPEPTMLVLLTLGAALLIPRAKRMRERGGSC